MQLTYPLPILFQEAMPTGVGADVMLPVGEGVMGWLVAPGVVGEPVPCKTGKSSATMNIHMHIVMKLFLPERQMYMVTHLSISITPHV